MKKFVVCIEPSGYSASLQFGKIYEVLPPKNNDRGLLRVIDESGEDYLYSPNMFHEIELPEALERRLSTHV